MSHSSMKRGILVVLACLALVAGAGAQAVKIGAIFAITGPAAYLGAPEDKTARLYVENLNKAGGINGKKVELIIKDSGGSAEKALSFAKQLVEENGVVAVIGPTTSGESIAIKDYMEKAGVPLISCAAAEAIVVPVAKYVFKTPQKDSYVVKWAFQTMKDMGIKKLAVVASNTGFGNGGKGNLEKMAPDAGIQIVLSEVYAADATDLSALVTKVKASGADALINWSIEPAQSIIAKNMRQLGLTMPLFQSHGFGNIGYVKAAGAAAEGIIFPCGRLIVADELSDSDPQKKLLQKYKNDYESKYKEDVSTFGGHAYDALLILQTAMTNAKSEKPDKIAEAIAKIKGLAGTAGTFNFTDEDHNGLGMDSISMLTVKNGKYTFYKGK
jgi:branched-chain amino acid transport system substrate-binding protein